MDFMDDNLAAVLAILAVVAIAGGVIGGILYALHFMLTLPMRRAERARLFLDILEIALDRGQRVEEGLIFISRRRGNVLSKGFAPLAACLQRRLRLDEALASVPANAKGRGFTNARRDQLSRRDRLRCHADSADAVQFYFHQGLTGVSADRRGHGHAALRPVGVSDVPPARLR